MRAFGISCANACGQKNLFPNGNVCSSQLSVSRDQRRFAQARLRLGSGPAQSAQVCLPYLRDIAQLRPISLKIIKF
jgi:hypothetical protein